MTRNGSSRRPPAWLQPLWKQKRAETVRRVAAAVCFLKRAGKTVTLAAIREAVLKLDGVSISTNTIQRNEEAYQLYQQHAAAGPAKSPSRHRALIALQKSTPDAHRAALRAKIARLRRQTKDMLIARVLELETAAANQGTRENALREEVLRLTFKAAQPGN
jgi:hypothetical protein